MEINEQWKPISGHDGYYEVSDCGRVRSFKHGACPIILKQGRNRRYPAVSLCRSGKNKSKPSVHRLVLEAFCGPCPEGCQGSHIDDDPNNNHISNLVWESAKKNIGRKISRGIGIGENHPSSKLHESDVLHAIDLYNGGGWSYRTIGDEIGVHACTIADIIKGRTWTHITAPEPMKEGE